MLTHRPSIQAVIFDLDGTLVDSEPIHRDAWRDVLAPFGFELTDEWFEGWIGCPEPHLGRVLEEEYRLPISAAESVRRKQARFRELASERSFIVPGAREAVAAFAETGCRLAVCTSCSRSIAEISLKASGLAEAFQVVLTLEDVARPKPDPEPYLRVAEMLGVAPRTSLVFEDSVSGVKAAEAAGMEVLAVGPLDRFLACNKYRNFSSLKAAADFARVEYFHR
ncbi:MAG: HAD family phosphatase [Sumerlaeia bacterium]